MGIKKVSFWQKIEENIFFPCYDSYVGVNNSTQSYQLIALIGFISYRYCKRKTNKQTNNPLKTKPLNLTKYYKG